MVTVLKADEHIERLVFSAVAAGCPRVQVENFMDRGYIPWAAMLPFHADAREADYPGGPDEIALGGSRGPGKSHAALAQVGLDDCQRVAGLKFLFLRRMQKTSAESLEDLTSKVFQYTPHELTREGVHFPNGSRIVIGGYKDAKDIEKYIGIEYDGIAIEECTQIQEERKEKVRGSMRSTKENWRPRMYLTTNADGIGLGWFKKQFIYPWRENRQTNTRFHQVLYKDNPLLDAGYVTWLEGLKGPLGKAWRDADWDAFEGMAFPLWNHDKHVCEPFSIPDGWTRWCAIDWGYASPWSCHWYVREPDTRRVYCYREAYQTNLTDREQAQKILERTQPGEKIVFHYADPSMWITKNRQGQVFTTADEYKEAGIILTKADNDRMSGKRKVNNILADLPDGEPGLMIFDTCPHMIEQLSTLASDENNREDVDTDQEDHAYDDLRYALTNEKRLDVPKPPKSHQHNPMEVVLGLRR
jgi:hypothetical protein